MVDNLMVIVFVGQILKCCLFIPNAVCSCMESSTHTSCPWSESVPCYSLLAILLCLKHSMFLTSEIEMARLPQSST